MRDAMGDAPDAPSGARGTGGISVLRARLPQHVPLPPDFGGRVGIGRDWWEARANAGWAEKEVEGELWDEIMVVNSPTSADEGFSSAVANAVCLYHVEDDQETPYPVRLELKRLLDAQLFADALVHLFDMIWDGGFESA